MAQIILQVLAVLGIILLCLLGLCLLLLLCLLFVPVRYRVSGKKDGEKMEGAVRLTWFLRLLSVSYKYPEPGEVTVRVAGIRVWSRRVGAGEKREKADEGKAAEEKMPGEKAADRKEIQEKAAGGEDTWEKETGGNDGISENAETPKAAKERNDAPKNGREEKGRESLAEKIRKLRRQIRLVRDKIKEILENITYYRELLLQKENRLLYKRCWEQLRRILRHIRPRVIRADLVVGTGAPDTTGYLLAVYGMLTPFLGNHINIVPDFNEPVLEGTLFARGRITAFVLLRGGVKILLDKQLHRLMGKLKREER